MSGPASPTTSIDAADVARFSAIAAEWWDPRGNFAPLHALNPTRLAFIRERALARFGRDGRDRTPFTGLRMLDIGCGGGLLCEPLARLGFAVIGLDASERNIAVARVHAEEQGLEIDYRVGAVEALLLANEKPVDLVVNMEVVEHVVEPGAFLRDSTRLLAPGGLMVLATLNRTLKSLSLAKIAAEHVLRWLPPGTHDWRKFVRPDEVRRYLAKEGLKIEGPSGMSFNPLTARWSISSDASINYLMTIYACSGPEASSNALQSRHTSRP
jgi:2-polyprenyl-6-hydroxyphenyl methylase/3-demethylubiquinone-9 3-methyltransferase